MKKLLVILGIILFIPLGVNAETITYNICKSGCEYSDLNTVSDTIETMSQNDIIINILDSEEYIINDKVFMNYYKGIEINGGNATLLVNNQLMIYSNTFKIKDLNIILNSSTLSIMASSELAGEINNLNVSCQGEEKCISIYITNLNIYNSNISSIGVLGNINIYNSNVGYVFNTGGKVNIYNSNFNNPLKYIRTKENESAGIDEIWDNYPEYTVHDIDFEYYQNQGLYSNTNVYFEKNKIIKQGSTIYIPDEFQYLEKNKEISYSIDNQAIAKVSDNKLTGVTPGTTKVTATTDDGHFIYTLNLTVEPANSGEIEKKEQKENNYAEADFSSDDLNSIIPLTSEEQAIKDSGKNIEVFLEVNNINETVSTEEKTLIEEKLTSNEEIATYLDVSLFKQVDGQEATKIDETNGNIKVSMKLPNNLINKDKSKLRKYYILRLHNGVVDKLDTVLNGDTLSFETNKFSTYALVYEDINNPPTGDNIIKYMGILFGSILLIVFIQISKLRKE